MVENNPHKISTMGQGGSLAAITDASDFPHTGLIKGLSLMARQNIVVKNNSNDFDITQSTANSGTVAVSAGTYLRDGKLYTAQYKTGTTAASFTFGSSELITTYDKGYHLVVVDKNNFILIRKPTVANKVPDYTSGDTIIAIVEYSSTTSSGARNIQFLTTDKAANSLSIAYDNSNVYTEVGNIEGASGGTTITSTGTLTLDADDTKITASSDGKPTLTLENTAGVASAANEPEIIFSRTGASDSSTSGDLGRIMFKGKDDGNATHTYAQITGEALDETGGTEDGRLRFITALGGADNTEFLRISGSEGVIVNHDKNNIDFSVMGDTNDHVLNVDAGTEKVGIGVNNAKTRLTVEGAITLKEQANADADTAAYGQIWTKTATPNELYFTNDAGNDIQLTTGATGPLLTGKHSIWVPSSAMTPLTTNGCSALTQVEMTAGRPELQVLDFAADADDHAQFTVAFPKSWNEGTVTFQPFWTVTGTNTGTAVWNLTGIGVDDNYVINSNYPSAAATGAKAHSGTSNDLNVSAESSALTITNASVDSVTYFKLSLETSSSSQTGTVRLIGLKMFYDINAGNDE